MATSAQAGLLNGGSSAPRQARAATSGTDVQLDWLAPELIPPDGIAYYLVERLSTSLYVTGWQHRGSSSSTSFTDYGALASAAGYLIYQITPVSPVGGAGDRTIVITVSPNDNCDGLMVSIPEGGLPRAEYNLTCVINESTEPLPEPYRTVVRSYMFQVCENVPGGCE